MELGGSAAGLGVTSGVIGPWGPILATAGGAVLDAAIGGNKGPSISAGDLRSLNRPRKDAWRKNERYAENMAKETNRYNTEMWQFGIDETNRQVLFAQQQRNDSIYNFQSQRDYDLKIATQRRDYAVAEQQFDFQNRMRAYNASRESAAQQFRFNEYAFQLANVQQSQYLGEQLMALQFDQAQSLFEYTAASAGLNFKKQQAKAQAETGLMAARQGAEMGLQTSAAKTAFGKRDLNIATLKKAGQLAARGQAGGSITKAIQGVEAEGGAQKAQLTKELALQQRQIMGDLMVNQRNVVNELISVTGQADLDLAKLDFQLEFDRAKIEASRNNLRAKDSIVRKQISLQKMQADMNAQASIMAKPELGPEIPPVIDLPDRRFTEVYVPGTPPKPIELTKEAFGGGQPEPTQKQLRAAIKAGMPTEQSFGDRLLGIATSPEFLTQMGSGIAGLVNKPPNLGGFNPTGNLGIDYSGLGTIPSVYNTGQLEQMGFFTDGLGLADYSVYTLNPYQAEGFRPTNSGF